MADDVRIVQLSTASSHVVSVAAWQNAQWGHLGPEMSLQERIEEVRGECAAS
ncbi:hypothetical protein [Halomonas sp. WWR20]